MGVTADANIYSVSPPKLIGLANDPDRTNPLRPDAPSSPYEFSTPQATAATPHDIEFLNSFFTNQKNAPELWWLDAAKQIQIITVLGAVLLIILSIKGMVERNYFGTAFFSVTGVFLILFSVFGNRRRDWCLIFAVVITAVSVSFYSAVECVLTAIATVHTFKLSDADLAKLGYSSRGLVLAVGILQWIFCVLATIYWGLIAYLNDKIVHLMREESVRTSQQPSDSNEETANTRVAGKAVGIGRDPTRAGTFIELV